jgi:glycosyltransferase involved in cell wall biosynthesis
MPDLAGQHVDLVLGTSVGGVGRHVRTLAERLVHCGATPVVHGPAPTEATFTFTAVGAHFAPVDIANGFAPARAVRAVKQLRRQLRQPSVVHAHGVRAGLVAATALRRTPAAARPPLIVTWHNVPTVSVSSRRLQGHLEARLAREAHINLAVSPDLVESIRRLGGRDVRLTPVGATPLPPPTQTPVETRTELMAEGRPIVLGLGRLHEQKGFDLLLDAAGSWQTHSPQPLLVIAGDGPDLDDLARLAVQKRLDVRWLGYVGDRRRIAALLYAADVVVVPSRWEGSPLAVHEALMAGRPVVATAVGGLPSLLRNDEVVFVPPEDPAALATAITRLLRQPADAAAVASAGRDAATRWPDADATADAVLSVYAEVLPR